MDSVANGSRDHERCSFLIVLEKDLKDKCTSGLRGGWEWPSQVVLMVSWICVMILAMSGRLRFHVG